MAWDKKYVPETLTCTMEPDGYYDEQYGIYKCSNCGEPWQFECDGPIENGWKRCPSCGAIIGTYKEAVQVGRYRTRIVLRVDTHSGRKEIFYSTWDFERVRDAFEHGRVIYAINDEGDLTLLNASVIPMMEIGDLREQDS